MKQEPISNRLLHENTIHYNRDSKKVLQQNQSNENKLYLKSESLFLEMNNQ